MFRSKSDASITVRKMGAADLSPALVEMLTNILSEEPMFVRLCLSRHQISEYVGRFLGVCTTNGLSVVAEDVFSKRPVAALLAVDHTRPFPSGESRFDASQALFPEYAPAVELIKTAEHEVDFPKYMRKLHILTAGVEPEYRGLGVLRKMTNLSLELALRQGYHMAIAECTSRAAVLALTRSGFETRGSYEYAAFEWNGTHPFRLDSSKKYAVDTSSHDRIIIAVKEMYEPSTVES
eukprot:ANDGO_04248.mRNA.1 hypothetical protein